LANRLKLLFTAKSSGSSQLLCLLLCLLLSLFFGLTFGCNFGFLGSDIRL